jgi:hypothetical protein
MEAQPDVAAEPLVAQAQVAHVLQELQLGHRRAHVQGFGGPDALGHGALDQLVERCHADGTKHLFRRTGVRADVTLLVGHYVHGVRGERNGRKYTWPSVPVLMVISYNTRQDRWFGIGYLWPPP